MVKLGKITKAIKMAGRNLTEVSYCVYLYGRNEIEAGEDKKTYKEFCRDIKDIHLQGKELWQRKISQ